MLCILKQTKFIEFTGKRVLFQFVAITKSQQKLFYSKELKFTTSINTNPINKNNNHLQIIKEQGFRSLGYLMNDKMEQDEDRVITKKKIRLMAEGQSEKIHKVIIIGSGPSAHTAAIYCSRANLEPLLFEGFMAGGVAAGGQLTTTTDVENFPGFPDGISGMEITENFRKQSLRFGTTIITETVSKVNVQERPFRVWLEGKENEAGYACHTLIIATGATAKRMHIPGEETYWQSGISACAVCDGAAPIFRNKELAVIGGGDSACEEAMFLTKFATKVYLVVRRDKLRASKVMQERLMKNKKIEIVWNHVPIEAVGDGRLLNGLKIQDVLNKEEKILPVNGLFYAIGHKPNTDPFVGQIELEQDGYIKVEPGTTNTNVPGVFACGDVQDRRYRQAITAAGTGCMSALDAEHYLEIHHPSQE